MSDNNDVEQVQWLYVGKLPADIEDDDLLNNLGYLEGLASVEFARKPKQSYAFLEFHTPAKAESALKALQSRNPKIMDKDIDIQWRTDPRLCKLFFKFTPKDTSDQVLQEILAEFGPTSSCRIMLGRENTRLDYGYVFYKHPAFAKAAIDAAGDEGILSVDENGPKIEIRRFLPKHLLYKSVLVENIPEQVDPKEFLEKIFPKLGTINSIKPQTKTGAWYVNFEDLKSASEAQRVLNGAKVEGREAKLVVTGLPKHKRGKAGGPKIQPKQVHVGNIGPGVDKERIRNVFGAFGEVVKVDLKASKKRRFAFVIYSDASGATNALEAKGGLDGNEAFKGAVVSSAIRHPSRNKLGAKTAQSAKRTD